MFGTGSTPRGISCGDFSTGLGQHVARWFRTGQDEHEGLYRFGPPEGVIPYVLCVADCIDMCAHDYNVFNCEGEACLYRGVPNPPYIDGGFQGYRSSRIRKTPIYLRESWNRPLRYPFPCRYPSDTPRFDLRLKAFDPVGPGSIHQPARLMGTSGQAHQWPI